VLDVNHRADRLLVMTSQAFDFEADELPANVRYVGPQLEPTSQSDWQAPWPSSDSRPLVLVGLSTSQMNQEPVLRKLIRVLGGMEVRALVTTGPALDPGGFDPSANVAVRSFVPHADVIPQSDLVITHAGHGTVIRALAAGSPLVCVPLGRDQFDITARVVWHGAGLKVSAKATEAALKEAIAHVLEDPSFRHSAKTLAKAISQETEQDLAVRELEGLASG
jgi:MGT family glycosyltransferase